jgi:exonuclease III
LFNYHIIVLSETRHTALSNPCVELFPSYSQHSIPNPKRGAPGGGLTALVCNELTAHTTVWRKQPETAALWLRIDGKPLGLDRPLFVAACYIPPVGSKQLKQVPLAQRYMDLAGAAAEARAEGYVILTGDFNAAVDPSAALEQSSEEARTSGPHTLPREAMFNASGGELAALCIALQLQWLTGQVAGDLSAGLSFVHKNGQGGSSRPDHVIVCPTIRHLATWARVRWDMIGSDHFPLTAGFQIHSWPEYSVAPRQPHLVWKKEAAEEFTRLLGDRADEAAALGTVADDEGTEAAAAALQGLVALATECAISSGCHMSTLNPRRKREPWYDMECIHLRSLMRRISSYNPKDPILRLKRRAYRAMCKSKKAAYNDGLLSTILHEARADPARFWRRLKKRSPALASLPAVQYWETIFNRAGQPEGHLVLGALQDEHMHMLNVPIQSHEVHDAMKALATGTSCGPDGCPPELLVNASRSPEFVGSLCSVFNWMFERGVLPEAWGCALMSLVYKAGDHSDWGNYRPIAVASVLAKVFAMVLNARLNQWAEAGNHRACTQAGFRPKYNTTMQAFVLSHMIEHFRAQKDMALYVCFVDFKKAFDSVPRHKLWQRMYDKGIRGKMLFTVQALNGNVTFAIKMYEGLSAPIASNIGVRQGCPLSPFLFGLFIELFHEDLTARLPLVGPLLNVFSGPRVPLLFFADDLVLLGLSQMELQGTS